MDELDWSSDEKSINVLTKDQEFLLEIADQIQNPLLRKQYLEKLKQGNLDGETKTPNYNLSEILKRHDKKRAHKTSFDAQKEIDNLRSEIVCLKFEQQQHSTIIGRLEELITGAPKPSASTDQTLMKQDKNPEETLALDQTKNDQHEALTMVGELSPNRWLIKITLIINHNLFIDATALIDTGADENCINEQIIPARFYEKTTESLSSVSGTKLDIRYKLSEVEVEQNRVRLIHFAQDMAVESAQEWLHHWLLELWQDDSLEKIQNDIQDGETDSMDRIFTAYIHKIRALIDHPVSNVLCAFFDRHCKEIPQCNSKPYFQHINSTLKTREDYELFIGHLALQAPACEGSSSMRKTHNHQDLPPKKRFCIKSSLTAWRPDPGNNSSWIIYGLP
ncbi:hypothetical protein CRG98_014991 [Punica granatum]|uniref:Peptidase A2 domain-containing protein n=1 Tax=Punica granatum TaxID=22663 RepID=A0A2I0K7M7_PUNGR|nr:hypothetical protein CRG98_014991 [Punica granatum]